MAAMAPAPAGTASCMNRPRAATSWAATGNANAPAQTRAVYSPKLWPANRAGLAPPCCSQTRHTATPAVNRAGWVFSVWFSAASGPLRHKGQSSKPRPSEASAKVSSTAGNRAAKSANIPTDWEPCPGNTHARWSLMSLFCLRGAGRGVRAAPGPPPR